MNFLELWDSNKRLDFYWCGHPDHDADPGISVGIFTVAVVQVLLKIQEVVDDFFCVNYFERLDVTLATYHSIFVLIRFMI